MPVGFGIYTVALAFMTAVAGVMIAYGVVDLRRGQDTFIGALEVGAGVLIGLYLLAFQFEGLSDSLLRALTQGPLIGRGYLLAAGLAGLVITDYLLRRLIPLLDAGTKRLAGAESGGQPTKRATTRRSILGLSLGITSLSIAGGFSLVDQILKSAGGDASDALAFGKQTTYEAPYFTTALTFSEAGYGYATSLEGRVLKFDVPTEETDSLSYTPVVTDIQYPQGIQAHDGTLYTIDNGSAAGGKYGLEEGYEVLQDSSARVLAFDIEADGSLSNRREILSTLPVVNSDHAVHQIEPGPDGRLYLSIGHLGGKKYPEMFDGNEYTPTAEDHPNYEYLGTVISFEPDGSDVQIMAKGLRNVYDITFDEQGNLFGANNDGMSMRSKVWESLLHITEGADFGYPEYGTFAQGNRDITDPLWVLDGVQSTGVETTDTIGTRPGVVVALSDGIHFVPIERRNDDVYVSQFLRPEPTVIEPPGTPIVVEAGPNDALWVGCVGRDDTFTLYEPAGED